ncbi:hypothetical protein AB0F81_27220 [Actinoplanes sp. NPDC024001]|uniref:hypothetical protein n=1 Tax=Actinoplanes sp. NPDC024001 TaxID=3154598 RepID=UPI0033E25A4F
MTAPVSDWAGIGIAEEIDAVAAAVSSRSWIDGTISGAGAALDGMSLAMDPVGGLLQYGIAWLIEHVEPLADSLDKLAGDAAVIAAQAQIWRTAAADLVTEAESLGRAAVGDVSGWSGPAGDAYRLWAGRQEQALRALGTGSGAMAAITEGSGGLIGAVRIMVRDAVAAVVARLIVYAGELIITAGVATPLVVGQVAALCASWSAKIAGWLRGLLASLRRLLDESEHLGGLVGSLSDHLRPAAKAGTDETPSGGGTPATTAADPPAAAAGSSPAAAAGASPAAASGGSPATATGGSPAAAAGGSPSAAIGGAPAAAAGGSPVAAAGGSPAAAADGSPVAAADGSPAAAVGGPPENAAAGTAPAGAADVRAAGERAVGGDVGMAADAGSGEPSGPGLAGRPPDSPDFDPGRDRATLGDGFQPGVVHDPEQRFEPKERAIADRLAGDGAMVHPRQRIDDVRGLTNPDAMVRIAADDAGTVTEFKTPESSSSGSVRANILAAGKQVASHGGGDVVIDGRAAGLSEETARQGYARAAGHAREHGSAMPERVRVILSDGTILEFP